MSGLIKTWPRRVSVNTCTIINLGKLWYSKSRGGGGVYVHASVCRRRVRGCSRETIFILLPPCLGRNTLDPLVTDPSWQLSDGRGASLNLLLINLSLRITLNIRSGWRGTGGICLCITGGRPLLEKPTRFISVIKWCVHSLKEALGGKGEGEKRVAGAETEAAGWREKNESGGKRGGGVASCVCLCVHVCKLVCAEPWNPKLVFIGSIQSIIPCSK